VLRESLDFGTHERLGLWSRPFLFENDLTPLWDAVSNQNERNRFVDRLLRDAGIEPIPLRHFAVWVAKLKPMVP
jgi:hypothetical protein